MTKFTFKYLDYSQKNNLWFNTSLSVKFYSTESKQSTDQMKDAITLSFSERKVLDNLGFDTNSLLQFDDIRSPHLNWDKSSSNHIKVFVLGDEENKILNSIEQFLSSLDDKKVYCIIPKIISGKNVTCLSRQLLVTKNTNALEIMNYLIFRIEMNSIKYNYYIGNNIYFDCREIVFSKAIDFNKFNSIKNQIRNIRKTSNISLNNLKYISLNYLPYHFNINSTCLLIDDNYQYKSFNGKLYRYTSDCNILLKTTDNTQKGYVFYKNYLLFEFNDVLIGNKLIRTIMDIKLNIDNDTQKLLYYECKLTTTYLSKQKRILTKDRKIITFDIETYKDYNGYFVPYACGWYDGENTNLYYLLDFNSPEEMLLKAFDDIMISKYKGYTIYIHNLKGFDGVFLFKPLLRKYLVKPLFKNNELLSMKLSTKIRPTINLKVLDSLSMLPSNLRSLAKAFKVDTQKGVFPYDFVNSSNLDYVGSIPHYENYKFDKNFTIKDYEQLVIPQWNLKRECFKYLTKDLISLSQVLNKMNEQIVDEFSLNIIDNISISSLAMSIYSNNFMNHKLPIIRGQVHEDIRQAYYGGRVDVFEPFGENLYYYDVNSLYPSAMLNDMPVGNPVYTTNSNLEELFGFVYVEVNTPKNMHIPILPYRTEEGLLINPLGSWSGWYFTEELKQAKEFGYKVNVKYGYTFERGKDVFKDFIEQCYFNKRNNQGVLKLIYKLLLNSLYGRMGINEIYESTKILQEKELNDLMKTNEIKQIYNMPNNEYLVKYNNLPDENLITLTGEEYDLRLLKYDGSTRKVKQSVSISAATTAYARMHMNKLMLGNDYKVFYTDTDSLVVDKPLPETLISQELGDLKLEYSIKEGLFIAPKLYLLITTEEDTVIKGRSIGSNLSYQDFKLLYNGMNITKFKEKWFKHIDLSTIEPKYIKINLSSKLNKRNKIIKDNKWISTSPFIINK